MVQTIMDIEIERPLHLSSMFSGAWHIEIGHGTMLTMSQKRMEKEERRAAEEKDKELHARRVEQAKKEKEKAAERAALKGLASASLVEDAKSWRERKRERRMEMEEKKEKKEVGKMKRELPAVAAAALSVLGEMEELEMGVEGMELS